MILVQQEKEKGGGGRISVFRVFRSFFPVNNEKDLEKEREDPRQSWSKVLRIYTKKLFFFMEDVITNQLPKENLRSFFFFSELGR